MTLSQLAQHADLWKAEPIFLLVIAVLTAPIVYVLANKFTYSTRRIAQLISAKVEDYIDRSFYFSDRISIE